MPLRVTAESEEGKAMVAGTTQTGTMICMKEACRGKSSVEDRREAVEGVGVDRVADAGVDVEAAEDGEAVVVAQEAVNSRIDLLGLLERLQPAGLFLYSLYLDTISCLRCPDHRRFFFALFSATVYPFIIPFDQHHRCLHGELRQIRGFAHNPRDPAVQHRINWGYVRACFPDRLPRHELTRYVQHDLSCE